MHLARLATRVVIGGLFVGHGTQKLLGSFGGPGIEGTQQMMGAIGMHPAKQHAYAAGVTETAGGAALALGLFTPTASASLIGTMITAVRKVHAPKGVWVTQGGYEYNAVLIAALAAIAEAGPGKFSLDAALGREKSGTRQAVLALALGAAASTAAIEYGRRNAPAVAAAPSGPVAEATQDDSAGDPTTVTATQG